MAKQHFYSRVPAKLSMFNRYDSFDTFAHSEGLTREFIEQELSCVYANKLSKNDAEAVRKNLIPPVYSQCALRSGAVVQTCTRYLPLDYTKERSAYLSHTLILTDEEQDQLLYTHQNAVFNPQMFDKDVSEFDFTSASMSADSSYPEAPYVLLPVQDTKAQIGQYDPDAIKRFLCSIFAVLCAKGKTVYFKLNCPDEEASEQALKLMNTVMTVVPFHLRNQLPFVTYVTDPSQYNHVKVKCLGAHCPEVSPAKGVFFDFHTGLVTGQQPSSVTDSFPAGFFYSLLENAPLRNAFLSFMDTAVKTLPALEKLNMKALADLVFLFCGSNATYDQQSILPTDAKVYDFLSVYDKYRSVMDEESRKNVYACLDRYPERHEAIPKNIFAKLSKLYPDEPDSVKRIAIRGVLELLHTDIMRDKLFTFIKNNYGGEDPEIRAVIHDDLSRVYYGGFLQAQILSFFSEYFAQEEEATQDAVLEKILLTVRTEAIQPKILAFISENYAAFTARQKQRIYDMVFEMLPECDQLSSLLVDLVNEHAVKEAPQQQEQFRKKIQALILVHDDLMPLACKASGFCSAAVMEMIIDEQTPKAVFDGYIAALSQKSVLCRVEELLRISNLAVSNGTDAMKQLVRALPKLFAPDTPEANLAAWLEADAMAAKLQETNPFAAFFKEKIIQPAITGALTDVFDRKQFPDGMGVIEKYARENPYLLDTKQYKMLQAFWYLESAIENKDTLTVFHGLSMLFKEPVRKQMADCIRADFSRKEIVEVEQQILYRVSLSVLKDGKFLSEDLYAQCKDVCLQQIIQSHGGKTGRNDAREAGVCAGAHIFSMLICACDTDMLFVKMLEEDKITLDGFLSECSADYASGASKTIMACFADAPAELLTLISESLERIKPINRGIFAKLFGGKR